MHKLVAKAQKEISVNSLVVLCRERRPLKRSMESLLRVQSRWQYGWS